MLGFCATVVKPYLLYPYLLYHERKAVCLVSRELCALCKEPTHICDAKYHDKIKKAAANHSGCCSACYSGRPVGFLVVDGTIKRCPSTPSI